MISIFHRNLVNYVCTILETSHTWAFLGFRHEASIKKNHQNRFIDIHLGSYYREAYSKNASGHYLSDRFHPKIDMDNNNPVPTWVSSHLNSGQASQMFLAMIFVKQCAQMTSPLRGLLITFDFFLDVRN